MTMNLLKLYLQKPNTQRILNRQPGEKGFSLIELVVVIAVLAVLTAIALPNFLGVSEDASARTAQQAALNAFKECKVLWARNKRGTTAVFVPPAVTDWSIMSNNKTDDFGDAPEYQDQPKSGLEIRCFTNAAVDKDVYAVPKSNKFPTYKVSADGIKWCKTGVEANGAETFNIGCASTSSKEEIEGWQ